MSLDSLDLRRSLILRLLQLVMVSGRRCLTRDRDPLLREVVLEEVQGVDLLAGEDLLKEEALCPVVLRKILFK
jgi:hypothetical protein